MFSQITMIDYSATVARRLEMRRWVGPYCWTPAKPNQGRAFYQHNGSLKVDAKGSTFNLRLEFANDHLTGRLARVYGYCMGHGEYIQPIIARLPHGRGFLAGWTMGSGMLASVDATIHASEHDAALAAHDEAASAAERERDASDETEE